MEEMMDRMRVEKESCDALVSMSFDIQNRIKDLCDSFYFEGYIPRDVLFQFWGVEEIEGELYLTTALQPFAFSNPGIKNEKLKKYRKHCVGYKLLVADEEASGIVGRVFRNQLPEFGPEPEYYSVIEYPQRDFAIRCGIKSIRALPVFQLPGLACGGVLELLSPIPTTISPLYDVESVNLALKSQRLSTTDMLQFFIQINQTYESQIQNEIETAVEQVCRTYRLALGVIWVSFQGELLVPSPKMSFFADQQHLTFLDDWKLRSPLKVNQGLVGKALSSHDLYYCRDVSQLSISEYPQVVFARKLGVAACFTACLRNISTGNHELVIEVSLYRDTTYNQDLHSLFSSILATMNQQLRSFKVVTGDKYIEIVNETHKQREQSSNELTSYMAISSPTTSEGDSLQSLGTTECSMISTCQKPYWPSSLRSKHINESDPFIPQSSFPVNTSAQRAESESSGWGNSETASTKWEKRDGYTMYADQPDIPILNRSRAESLSPGTPLSEASAIYADVQMITHGELMTIKVRYKEDIIRFYLPHSSSYADLMESILHRRSWLKDKSFVIKYLNDSIEPVLLATDMDLQECMVWTRSKHMNLIRMIIELE